MVDCTGGLYDLDDEPDDSHPMTQSRSSAQMVSHRNCLQFSIAKGNWRFQYKYTYILPLLPRRIGVVKNCLVQEPCVCGTACHAQIETINQVVMPASFREIEFVYLQSCPLAIPYCSCVYQTYFIEAQMLFRPLFPGLRYSSRVSIFLTPPHGLSP